MLLAYGRPTVDRDWKVQETHPTGYSRVYFVHSGVVCYRDADQVQWLRPGHLYVFPSASPYSMTQDPENRLHCTYVHIDVFPSLITSLVDVDTAQEPALRHILQALATSMDAGNVKIITAMTDVFVLYCRENGLIAGSDDRIARIQRFIAEHWNEPLSIASLSAIAGYNEQYFIRFFREKTGVTPHQYLIGYRLKEARRLLQTGASITEIAHRTGYADIKAFGRSFRTYFGVSPTSYRRKPAIVP
jgi:AraC-like DNA-binding protein